MATLAISSAVIEQSVIYERYFPLYSKLKDSNVFAVHADESGLIEYLAARSFNVDVESANLFYMPEGNCFLFDDDTVVIPLFGTSTTVVVYEHAIVGNYRDQKIYRGTSLGVVNTGSQSLSLVAKCKTF